MESTPTVGTPAGPLSELGSMLAEARMRCGWRGREAARLLGISRSQLVGLEAGLRSPDPTLAERLAEGLALTPHESSLLLAATTANGAAAEAAATAARPRA